MTPQDIILNAVKELGRETENPSLIDADEKTALFGRNLDSRGILSLVSENEECVSEDLDVDIVLADERAMSQKTSPFLNVKTLTKYIEVLIAEAHESSQ